MIVVDTTVLVYATGVAHPLRDPCQRLVQAVAAGIVAATTTPEVVQEFVHVRARRRGRRDAAELGSAYADLLAPLLPVTAEQLREGLRIYQRADRLGAFDAVLAATALDIGADTLVSADRAFGSVPRLPFVVPDEDGVKGLLAPG
jgi:uncharacterized protein